MINKTFARNWYVLYTKSRFENIVNDGLVKKSIEVFLPKILVRSKRRDRKVMIRVPLFPGYLFVKTEFDPHKRIDILQTVGVVSFIGNKDGPVPVLSETVESLKIIVAADDKVLTGHGFKKGDHVTVIYGPFTGVSGTFVRYRGKGRVIVNISALGQFTGVDVSEEDVERIPDILS